MSTFPPSSPSSQPVPDSVDNELFDRYIAGQCTPLEVRRIHDWLATQPVLGDVVAELRSPGNPDDMRRLDVDTDWQRVQQQMQHQMQHQVQQQTTPVRKSARVLRQEKGGWIFGIRRGVIYPLLAVIMGLSAFGVYRYLKTTTSESQTQYYATQRGERITVVLHDGSRVVLAPASELSVAGRTVTLDGQALFTVTHRRGDPFTVITRTAKTVVLGTTFMIRSYDSDADTRMVVAEGRIQVNARRNTRLDAGFDTGQVSSDPVVLAVGDAARVNEQGVKRVSGVQLDAVLGWAQGKLVFEQTPLPNVLADIGRTYGMDIQIVTPSLRDRKITATFSSTNGYAVLDEIAFAIGARYTQNGTLIEFWED